MWERIVHVDGDRASSIQIQYLVMCLLLLCLMLNTYTLQHQYSQHFHSICASLKGILSLL